MRTQLLTLVVLAGTGMLLASSPAAVAAVQTYDFTFTGGSGMDATGTISVNNGIAQSGSINVTGVPLEATPTTLINASGALIPDPAAPGSLTLLNHDGDNIIIDNVVNIGSDPVLTGNGLGFASGQYQDSVHFNTLINIWGNSPGSYTLFVAEAQLDANGNVIGDPQWVYAADNGSLTLTAAPEPATYGAISGVGLILVSFGRQFRRKKA